MPALFVGNSDKAAGCVVRIPGRLRRLSPFGPLSDLGFEFWNLGPERIPHAP